MLWRMETNTCNQKHILMYWIKEGRAFVLLSSFRNTNSWVIGLVCTAQWQQRCGCVCTRERLREKKWNAKARDERTHCKGGPHERGMAVHSGEAWHRKKRTSAKSAKNWTYQMYFGTPNMSETSDKLALGSFWNSLQSKACILQHPKQDSTTKRDIQASKWRDSPAEIGTTCRSWTVCKKLRTGRVRPNRLLAELQQMRPLVEGWNREMPKYFDF